ERLPGRGDRPDRRARAARRRGLAPAPHRRARRARSGGRDRHADPPLPLRRLRSADVLHCAHHRRRRLLDPLPRPLDLMHPADLAVDILLAFGVVAELLCVVGIVVMRTTLDRLHYAAACTTVPAFLILAATLVREHLSSGGLEAIATVALLFLLNPALVITTARAAHGADDPDFDA